MVEQGILRYATIAHKQQTGHSAGGQWLRWLPTSRVLLVLVGNGCMHCPHQQQQTGHSHQRHCLRQLCQAEDLSRCAQKIGIRGRIPLKCEIFFSVQQSQEKKSHMILFDTYVQYTALYIGWACSKILAGLVPFLWVEDWRWERAWPACHRRTGGFRWCQGLRRQPARFSSGIIWGMCEYFFLAFARSPESHWYRSLQTRNCDMEQFWGVSASH